MIPIPPFSSCAAPGYDFSAGRFNRYVFVGRPMIAFINGGVPPYTWSITGSEFTLANLTTSSQFNRIVTNSNTVIGESVAEVTVTDSCGREVSFTINCCAAYLCCDQQTIPFSIDNVEQLPTSDSVINIYGGCPPFRWLSLDSRARFITEWTEVRQNILLYDDISDVRGIQYEVIDHCGSVAEGFVYEEFPTYTFYFWGDNQWGCSHMGIMGLGGIGSAYETPTPITDTPNNPYTHIWSSYTTSFAKKKDGSYTCVGYNLYGALGLGTNDWEPDPVPMVLPLPDVDIEDFCIGPNYHSIMLLEGGLLYSTGINHVGQLGVGNTVDRNTWTQIPGSWNKIFPTLTSTHSAQQVGGNLYMWGANSHGRIPGVAYTDQSSPVLIGGISNIRFVGSGPYGTIFLTDFGEFYGSGAAPYTGLPATVGNTLTNFIPPFVGVKSISYGYANCVAIANNGTMWTFGTDSYGKLGIFPRPGNQATFVQIGVDSDWEEVMCGLDVVFAKKSNGDIYHWGINRSAQLGIDDKDATIVYEEPTLWRWKFDESLPKCYNTHIAKIPI